MASPNVKRYLENYQGELDGAALYHALAQAEKNTKLAQVYENLAKMEEKHRGFWEERLTKEGVSHPPNKPSWRMRVLIWITERFGPDSVLSTVAGFEKTDKNMYVSQEETKGTGMTADEHLHDRVLEEILKVDKEGASGSYLAQLEGRHKSVGGNALRAAVLGANDGLCSNMSLVMGVAGASFNNHILLLTGLAGLLAGACSMALGEWLSVTSARELAEREIRVESEEFDLDPLAEGEELQLIYESKGMKPEAAKALAGHMVANKERAMDALTREELGINPEDKGGNAYQAAAVSFGLFSLGAIIPVSPIFFLQGAPAVVASAVLSAIALFVFGALGTLFTGKPVLVAGSRQLALGLLAAGVTFLLGHLLGVSLS
jgi:VIT1/CCC1 family predicted Fe2+/Mn2+ transporter